MNWSDVIARCPTVSLVVGDHKIEFDYWEDALEGDYYKEEDPTSIPVYHLTHYIKNIHEEWEIVWESPTVWDLSTSWLALVTLLNYMMPHVQVTGQLGSMPDLPIHACQARWLSGYRESRQLVSRPPSSADIRG